MLGIVNRQSAKTFSRRIVELELAGLAPAFTYQGELA